MEEYLTVKEFAQKTSLAEITIRLWIRNKSIKSIKIGKARRIPISEYYRLTQQTGGQG